MTAVADIRIVEAGTIKLNDMLEQIVPELMYEAAECINHFDQVIEKFPDHIFELNKMMDLKLKCIKEKYLCDKINDRINRTKLETAKKVLDWAKDKSFGPLLGKNGQLDMKKAVKLTGTWGKEKMRQIINEYNEQLVPYSNEVLGKHGVWSKEELVKAHNLQNLQREYNELAVKMRKVLN